MINHLAAKTRILARLREAGEPLAVHELKIMGISDNAAATRLSELQASGLVVGEYRPHSAYKHWRLAKDGEVVKVSKPKPIPAAVVGVEETISDGFKRLTVSIPPTLAGKEIIWDVAARTV